MRLESILDSIYLLGSLSGGLFDPQGCTLRPPAVPRGAHEVTWVLQPEAAGVTAFVNVNVVPMDTERVLLNHTVLVEGGRITALGPTDKIKVPAGAVRIDARGKYLLPGLADMHAHLPWYDADEIQRRLFSYVAHGVTTVRSIDPSNDSLAKRWRAPLVRPHLYLGIVIEPSSDLTRLGRLAIEVAATKAAGYAFLDISNHFYSPGHHRWVDSLKVVASRLRFPLSSHSNAESFEDVLDIGRHGGSVEHLYAFRDLLARPAADVSDAEVRALATAVQQAGTWMDVTLDCTEQRKLPRGDITTARRIVKALQDAGARLLLGADADRAHGISPSVVHEELAELVRAGLTPYQALVAGTRNAARYLGILDSIGTITVGKRADLILVHGNPLANIRYTLEPAGVMLAGQWFDRAALDQGLFAFPKLWFKEEILNGMMPQITPEQQAVKKHYKRFEALLDSLPPEPIPTTDQSTYERMLQELTTELGLIRAILSPVQRETFDPQARVWMRQHSRRGFREAVSGVARVP